MARNVGSSPQATKFAVRLSKTQRRCDCGEPAQYDVPIRIGGHYAGSGSGHDIPLRSDSLYLCAHCYVLHLEMELERRAGPDVRLEVGQC